MTDPTIAYPPHDAGLASGCCEHVPNLHDRQHCLSPGCECTREAFVLRWHRQLAELRAQRERAEAEAAEEPAAVPAGYDEYRLSFSVCRACGCLVGDTDRHDEFVARGGHG